MERAALEAVQAAAKPVSAGTGERNVRTEARPADQAVSTHPGVLVAEYWQEEGAWSAYVEKLGVSAVGDTQAEVFAALAEAVDEYWSILNERYETLSDDLRGLLDLRYSDLTFIQRAA